MHKSRRKKRPRAKQTNPPVAEKTLRDLARKVKRSPSTVSAWIHRPDWPFARHPPWDAQKVSAWAELALAPNPADAWNQVKGKIASGETRGFGDLARLKLQAEVQLLIERVAAARTGRDEREGKLHPVAACRDRRLRQIHAVKSALFDLARLLPPALEGRPPIAMRQILRDRFAGLCRTFAGDPEGAASPDAPEPIPPAPAPAAEAAP